MLYFTQPWLFEKCACLQDGTKVCGDTELVKIVNYTIYTTAETEFTYDKLGVGFIHNDKATNYYVRVNFSIDNIYEAVGEKKFIVNFLDHNDNYLDSSWYKLHDIGEWTGILLQIRCVIFTISKDSMGDNFEKVEKISFRISDSLRSEDNRCYAYDFTKYHDQRLFGIWLNDSVPVNDTCPDLFREYTFYPNGTGMTSHGEFYWDTTVERWENEFIYVDIHSWKFNDIVSDNPHMEYEARLYFKFSNNNNTVKFDNGLYGGGYHYCYGFNYSLNYTKQ